MRHGAYRMQMKQDGRDLSWCHRHQETVASKLSLGEISFTLNRVIHPNPNKHPITHLLYKIKLLTYNSYTKVNSF